MTPPRYDKFSTILSPQLSIVGLSRISTPFPGLIVVVVAVVVVELDMRPEDMNLGGEMVPPQWN